MSDRIIVESKATGQEIHDIVANLEPILYDVKRSHAVIALLSLSLALMDPSITAEEVQEGVRSVSQYICLYLDQAHVMRGAGEEGHVCEVLN